MHVDAIPLTQLIDRFLHRWEQRGLAPLTLVHYRNTIRLFRQFLDGRPLTSRDVTTDLAGAFGAWLRETPLSHPKRGIDRRTPLSVDKHLADLKQLVSFGQEEGLIDAATKVRFPPKPKHLVEAYTDAQLEAIWGCKYLSDGSELATRNRALVGPLLDAGLRIGEAAHLTPAELYPEDRLVRVIGKGDKERFVPFSASCARELEAWLAIRQEGAATIFEVSDKAMQYIFLQISKEVGFRVHAHGFRHTCATKLLANGADIYIVKRILGHEDLRTTLGYLQLQTETIREKHEAFSPLTSFQQRSRPQAPKRRRLARDRMRVIAGGRNVG